MPGTQSQFCQECAVPQPTDIVPGNRFRLSPNKGDSCARTCTGHSAARSLIQNSGLSPSQSVSEVAGPHGLFVSSTSVRPAPLKPRVLSHSRRLGHLCVRVDQACITALAPWKDHQWMERGVPLGMVCRRKVISTDTSNMGWQTSFQPLDKKGRLASHQLPGNAGNVSGPSHLSGRPKGILRIGPFGQHDGGVLYKSPGWSLLEALLHTVGAPLRMGPAQLALTESSLYTGQIKPRSIYAVSVQHSLRGVDAPPSNSSENLGNLRQGRGRPLRLRRQLSLPNLPRLAQSPPLCFSPDRSDAAGNQASQGTETQGSVGGPALEEPALVCRAELAAFGSPVAHSPETGPPLPGEQNDIEPPA
ncbi:uncharacterized protein LOC122139569 [Cyprinus carpio]|uniref:Uncharacterized protein LOC122139569 n=1 Tax=Cyprinus carpio TaxID=7962 RepID=A0A9Q9X1W0_CYPCA|nr:uncharacterized protein LOC122139569 [Cyprinus carpio]